MKHIDIEILTNIKGLGSVNIVKILDYCKSQDIQSLYELKNIDLAGTVNKKLAETIKMYLNTNLDNLYEDMEKLIDDYKKNNIYCIAYTSDKYPQILKDSTNPPVILYCKGNIDLLNTPCAAVIGTRQPTSIGETIARKTAEMLVKNDYTIVSGLAKGIDSISHKVALDKHANTIAILPLIDKIYPAEHKELAQEILDGGGLLISEVKPNTKFHLGQLVKRDRIQSGLSKGVFVIETAINGGSMHAVNDALKLHRPVYTHDLYEFDESYYKLKQVEGIKKLIDTKRSIKYTEKDYASILSRLNLAYKM